MYAGSLKLEAQRPMTVVSWFMSRQPYVNLGACRRQETSAGKRFYCVTAVFAIRRGSYEGGEMIRRDGTHHIESLDGDGCTLAV